MDVNKLWEYADNFRFNGTTVADEEVALLYNALIRLRADNQFKYMYFWGKIYGSENDYYIAFGFFNDAIKDRKFFWSNDMTNWNLLPKPKNKHKKLAYICTSGFTGNSALKMKVTDDALDDGDKDKTHYLVEEARLSAAVETITSECAIKARGELLKLPDGTTTVNPTFCGLNHEDSKELRTYQHYRTPQFKWNSNLLRRKDYNYSLDILDTVDTDIPKGCWTIKWDHLNDVVFVKNFYWIGMKYFHKLNTPDAGFVYIGDGLKCLDVPFFLL